MLFSKKKRFLFVHVPKTGGTSIVSVLKKDSNRVPLPLRAIGYAFDDRGVKLPSWTYPITGYPYHVSAKALKEFWGDEEFSKYYKFAFVRNPWDLTVSEYFYILRKKNHHLHRKVSKLNGFEDFVSWKENNYVRPQANWLCDHEGHLLMDFVGKFENYTNDANNILKELGSSMVVPHKNATQKSDFREYYNDELVERVAEIYAPDIELFGYSFE